MLIIDNMNAIQGRLKIGNDSRGKVMPNIFKRLRSIAAIQILQSI
jgi:hypothetical protein